MRLFIFRSDQNPALHAFAGGPESDTLPRQFAPWHAIGVVREDKDPPHNLDRGKIEKAIGAEGFQLFRVKEQAKPKAKAETKTKAGARG